MKTVKKEVKVLSVDIGVDIVSKYYTYTFISEECIDISTAKLLVDAEEPETINEFLDVKCISKKDLVEWLNKNYK